MSFVEAWSNIFVGYVINLIANALILPHFVEGFTLQDNLIVGLIYTSISLVRQYIIRRWFNNQLYKLGAKNET
jgi:hypothetical protein